MSIQKPAPPDQNLLESMLHEGEQGSDESRAALIMRADRLIPQLQERGGQFIQWISQTRELIRCCEAKILEIETLKNQPAKSVMEDWIKSRQSQHTSQFFRNLLQQPSFPDSSRRIIDAIFIHHDKTAAVFCDQIHRLIERASQIIDPQKEVERTFQFQEETEETRDLKEKLKREKEKMRAMVKECWDIISTFNQWSRCHQEIMSSPVKEEQHAYIRDDIFPVRDILDPRRVAISWKFNEEEGVQWASYRSLVTDEQPFAEAQILTLDESRHSINDWVVTREPAGTYFHFFTRAPRAKITNRRLQILTEKEIPEKIAEIWRILTDIWSTGPKFIKDEELRIEHCLDPHDNRRVDEASFQAFLEPLNNIRNIVEEIRGRARTYLEAAKGELENNEKALRRVMDAIANS